MLRFLFNLLLCGIIFSVILAASVGLYVLPNLPDIETLKDVRMQIPLRIYTADLSLIGEIGEKRRTPVDIENVPQQLIDAFIAAEDDRFYEHPGVDWQGITRAVINLIKTGKKTQGGSTITMQVARNFFLTREKSYLRKLNEVILAFKIEKELKKDEILELYINKIYLGQRAYGVGAAAQVYYGKELKDLSLAQLAMIAGLPKAPSTTNPVSNRDRAVKRRNYVLLRMLDKNFITKKMFDEANSAPVTASLHSTDIEIEAPYVAEMVRKHLIDIYGEETYNAGYRVITTIRDINQTAANQALREALLEYDDRHGYRGPEHHYDLEKYSDEQQYQQLLESFPVVSNLDPALVVETGEKSARVYTSGIGFRDIEWDGLSWARKYINENLRGPEPESAKDIISAGDIVRIIETDVDQWKLTQIPAVEGALVSLRPQDGATLALVGGFYYNRSKFNRVTQALRQPGSGFKPFIYSAALNAGKTAASIFNDAPYVYDDPGHEDVWRPENYSSKYYGPTRLREALMHSRNLVSIRLLDEIKVRNALPHIAKFGFDTDKLPQNLSLALGSGALSPWQLASSYCVFANGGYKVEPYFIDRIESHNNEIIYKADPLTVCSDCVEENPDNNIPGDIEPEIKITAVDSQTAINNDQHEITAKQEDKVRIAPRVVDARNIWIMNSITMDVIKRGTGRRALVLNRKDLSGKTGTTNDQRDAWFTGYNSSMVSVSWVGFDNYNPLGNRETGARAALPMWIRYMRVALENVPENIPERPTDLVEVRIDPNTGKLAKSDDPDAIFETFRTEYAPVDTNEVREADIFNENEETENIPEQLF